MTPPATALKNRIENLLAMAHLLERVEARPTLVGAAQYQSLVRTVGSLLEDDLPPDAVQAVLRRFPATAAVYENLHYDRSGLSQSPLEAAINSELLADQVIAKARGLGLPGA